MICQAATLIKSVRTAMGLSEGSAMDTRGRDIVSIDDVIMSVLPRADDDTALQAPLHAVADITADLREADIFWDHISPGHCYGHIILPRNFLRLVTFAMSGWATPVTEPTPAGDIRHALAYCGVPALQGTPRRPQCLLSMRHGAAVLEFRSCTGTDAIITEARYIPRARFDRQGGMPVAQACLDRIIVTAAAMCRQIIDK